MSGLRIRLFGPPEVESDGVALVLPTRKALALLIYLVAEPYPHQREHLMGLLWPDADPARARASLRRVIAWLRSGLPPGYLDIHGQTAAIVPSSEMWCDTAVVQEVLEEAEGWGDALGGTPLSTADRVDYMRTRLEEALSLVRGSFLEGFFPDAAPYEAWLEGQRTRWQSVATDLFDRLTALLLSRGETRTARVVAGRWRLVNPLSGSPYLRLIECAGAAGDAAEARRIFQECRAMLELEFGAEPSPQATELRRGALHAARLRAPEAGGPMYLPWTGREDEFLALTEAFLSGGTRLAAIMGEPGVGKTRLAHEFLQRVRVHGADVLEGHGLQVGRIPYAPVVEALRTRLERENAPDDLLADPWLMELSRILPELRERYPDLGQTVEDGTAIRIFDAVVTLGEALATRAPVVFFVDDWQWADSATRDLLAYAAQRWHAAGASILILLTSRPDEGSAGWIRRLARCLPCTHIPLRTMDADAMRRLVNEVLGERAAAEIGAWLVDLTGGHPLYLEETLRTLVARGILRRNDLRDVNVERWRAECRAGVRVEGIERVVSSRLEDLPADALALLRAASVLDHGATFVVLRQVAGLDEEKALAALDRAQSALLLAPRGSDYVLPHDRVREVIYDEMGAARRRLFHSRALDALQKDSPTSGLLAYHARCAHQPGAALQWGLAAAREAMRVFAWRDAVDVLRETHDILAPFSAPMFASPDTSPEALTELFLTWGRAHELLGELAAARAVYDEMATVGRVADVRSMMARALTAQAMLIVQDSLDLMTARQLLGLAVRAGREAGDVALVAEAEWCLAQIAFYVWNAPAIWKHAQRARRSMTEAAMPHLWARCLGAMGYALSGLGRWRQAETCFSEARERFNVLNDRAMEADCLAQIGLVRFYDNRTDAALQVLWSAQQIVTEIDNPWGQVAVLALLTHPLLVRHELSHALRAAEEAVAISRRNSLDAVLLYALLRLGAVQRECGEVDSAILTHREASALNDAMPPRPMRTMLAAELCADEVIRGHWEEAACLAAIAEQARYYPGWYASLLSPAITAGLLAGGHVTRVKADLERLQTIVSRHPRYSDAYAGSRIIFETWIATGGDRESIRRLVMGPQSVGRP